MGEVVPPILTAEEWTVALLQLREATMLRQVERRDRLELVLRFHNAALAVEFNAWEEERDRADAEQERAEVAEAILGDMLRIYDWSGVTPNGEWDHLIARARAAVLKGQTHAG